MVAEMGQDEAMDRSAAHEVDWAEVQFEYETGTQQSDLQQRYGVTTSQIRYRRERDGWASPHARKLDRVGLVAAMMGILGRQVVLLERQMKAKQKQTELKERDVGLLNNMARTLEKLMELDARQKGATSTRKPPSNMLELRAKLAERLAQLERR